MVQILPLSKSQDFPVLVVTIGTLARDVAAYAASGQKSRPSQDLVCFAPRTPEKMHSAVPSWKKVERPENTP